MSSDLIERLEEQKERAGKTWTTVADELGISTPTLRKYRSDRLSPSPASKKKIWRWLGDQQEEKRPYSGPADLPDGADSEGEAVARAMSSGAYDGPSISGATAEESFDPEQAIQEQARRFRQKHRRAQKKKSQNIRFDSGPVMIAFVGDQHIGNAGTDIKRVFREQKTIMQTPRAYAWLMGDVVDNFVVGRLKDQNMKPAAPIWEQWQLAEEYLDRWQDRIVAFVGGNHGAWTMSQTQIDYRRDVCPDGVLFDGDDVQATLQVGSADYDIWARHKWKGNSIYNQTHGQERAARFNDPNHDLYVGAHTHEGALYREMIHEGQRKAAVQIGAYKVHDDYARSQGFPPSDMSTACAVIFHDDGSMHGMADLDAAKRYMKAVYGRAAA
jgi:hypothetical protein